MDIWKKAERNGSDDVLLHRFEKGAQVPRVMYPERGPHRDIEYFKIFGPTIIATNKGVHKILETRAILINMPEAGRRFERDVRPQDALSLKARLLAFRARYIDAALPETAKPANGRLGDILKPLLQMVCLVRPERHTAFMQLVSKLESERMTDESDSLEGHILEAIIRKEVEVRGNMLPVKDIAEAINENRSEHFQVSSHTIGRRLKAMGFTKTRGGDGSAAIVWDNDKIEKMRPKYGLKESSDISEPSEDTAYRGDGASESDDSEDSEGKKWCR
jgi:hypothetical protein